MKMSRRAALTETTNVGMWMALGLIIMNVLAPSLAGIHVAAIVSGSMEPGFQRGDILFVRTSGDPIRTGQIVVFTDQGRQMPIVHRVTEVHERRRDSAEIDVLTKGDNNGVNDRALYADSQLWLHQHHIMGRAVGYLPYVGWIPVIVQDKIIPAVKNASGLLVKV